MVTLYQATFEYFSNGNHSDLGFHNQCTILAQAYNLPLVFTNESIVDFETPKCIHCWSSDVRKVGTVMKKFLGQNDKGERQEVSHYYCNHCEKNSSPVLKNVYYYNAEKEGIQNINDLNEVLEKVTKQNSDTEELIDKLYKSVKKVYTEHLNFPRKKNVIYNKSDFTDVLIKNITDCQTSEMSSNLLNLSEVGKQFPSADTLLLYLGRNSENDIRESVKKIFNRINENAKKEGMYDEPLPIAVDFHNEPYYGKVKGKTIKTAKSKSHAGTLYNFKYATVDIAKENHRLTVFGQHISQLDTKADIFKEILEYSKMHVPIDYVMADREFYTAEILNYLESNFKYIIPALQTEKLRKEAKKNYDYGTYVFPYTINKNKTSDEQANIKIFVIRNKDFDVKKKITKSNKEFFTFATNLEINEADKNSENKKYCDSNSYTGYLRHELADMYTERWGIETDYRVYSHEFRPRTTSNKFPIRYLFFFLGEIMRNLWIMATRKFQLQIQKVLPKGILRAKIFKYFLKKGMERNRLKKFLLSLREKSNRALKMLEASRHEMSY